MAKNSTQLASEIDKAQKSATQLLSNNKKPTIINTVPKNWQKIFNIIENPNAERDCFITFEAFSPPTLNYFKQVFSGQPAYGFKPYSKREAYKFFIPNNEISESINHNYSNDASTFATAMNNINSGIQSVANSWINLLTGSDKGTVYDAPFLWKNAERRKFTIILDLFAYDNLNDDIYAPIAFFRKNSYPSRGATTKIGGLIEYPAVFKITGSAFETLNAQADLNYYTLQNMSIKYSNHTKFQKDGIPMSATVSLAFEEVINIYADMFDVLKPQKTVEKYGKGINVGQGVVESNSIQGIDIKKITGKITSDVGGGTFNIAKTIQSQGIQVINALKEIIKENPLYQKISGLTTLNPVHVLEVEQISSKTVANLFKKVLPGNVINVGHLAEIQRILTKSKG